MSQEQWVMEQLIAGRKLSLVEAFREGGMTNSSFNRALFHVKKETPVGYKYCSKKVRLANGGSMAIHWFEQLIPSDPQTELELEVVRL